MKNGLKYATHSWSYTTADHDIYKVFKEHEVIERLVVYKTKLIESLTSSDSNSSKIDVKENAHVLILMETDNAFYTIEKTNYAIVVQLDILEYYLVHYRQGVSRSKILDIKEKQLWGFNIMKHIKPILLNSINEGYIVG